MSDGKQPATIAPDAISRESAAEPSSREKESGRVAFDSRGNSIWEWRTEDGEFARDASTSLVKKLEAHELSLEATVIARRRHDDTSKKPAPPGGGFDPYDNAAAAARIGSTARRPVPVRPPPRPAANAQRTRPGLLKKLKSWMAGKGFSPVR